MAKTRKSYKKSRTIKRRKSSRGAGFPEGLRTKTKKMRDNSPNRIRTINPNEKNRFNRSGRNYVTSTQPIETQPIEHLNELKESNVLSSSYGPSGSSFYYGPGYHTQKTQPIPHGKDGMLVYSTRHVYNGDFNQGKREGFGTFTVKEGKINGPSYQGEWKDDKFVPFTDWKSQNK